MMAYNYGKSLDVNSGGSTAGGIYGSRPVVGDPNADGPAFSNFNLMHRFIASANYSIEYAKHLKTTIGAFLTVNSGFHYSYTYSSDVNGDGQTNDLMYIPTNQSEISLAADPATGRTAAQVWSQLDAFISQDPYLSKHRGAFAERNGARTPGNSQLDLRLLQDFFVDVKGKRNTLQLSLDIFNFGNLIDPNWGVVKSANRSQPLGLVSISAAGVPTYTMGLQNNASLTPYTNSFANNTGITSRWQMQVGLRYIFN